MIRRRVAVIQTDKHGGHKLGLCSPEVVLPADDEIGRPAPYTPDLTAFQKVLWNWYLDDIEAVMRFAAGDEVVLFDLGDQTHGLKYPEHLMTTRLADQIIIAVANEMPWFEFDNVVKARFAKGTGSHVFGQGSAEIIITEQLRALYPERDFRCLYHGVADLGGVTLDWAHHGPGPGIRDWTRGNQVRYHLRDLVYRQRRHAEHWPARLYVRGHRHSWARETLYETWQGEEYIYDLFTLPSYCGLGDYGQQMLQSLPFQSYGLVAIELLDGEVGRIKPYMRVQDIRTWERL